MATYYVGYDGSGNLGNDASAGTSFATRRATISSALGLLTTNGDVLVVCANSTYPLAAGGTLPRANATNNPGRIVGGNPADSGAVDGTIAWIDLNSAAAFGITDGLLARGGWIIENLGVKRGTSHGFYIGSTSSRGILFLNCWSQSNGGDGFNAQVRQSQFYGCTASSNTGKGFTCASAIVGCTAASNGSDGVALAAFGNRGIFLSGCTCYGNGGKGVNLAEGGSDADSPNVIAHCTLNGNTGDGIYFSTDYNGILAVFIDTIIANNGGYGVNAAAATAITRRRCHCYNNTSGNFNNVSLPGSLSADETSGDPKYVNAGAGNFRPLIGSPAIRSSGDWAGAVAPYRRDWSLAGARS